MNNFLTFVFKHRGRICLLLGDIFLVSFTWITLGFRAVLLLLSFILFFTSLSMDERDF